MQNIRLHPSVPMAWSQYCVDVGATFREYVAGFIILETPVENVDAAAHGFPALHARIVRESDTKAAA